MTSVIIGIDPGDKGAAVPLVDGRPITRGGRPLAVRWQDGDTQTRVRALGGLLGRLRAAGVDVQRPDLVVVERIPINFKGHRQRGEAGLIEEAGAFVGICAAFEWPVARRLAGAWLPDVALPREGWTNGKPKTGAEKVRAIAAARRWWPDVDWRPVGGKHRRPHDGLVDAALLALVEHNARVDPGPWAVERDGTGKGWRRVYPDPEKADQHGSRFRAAYTFKDMAEKASRGAVRLLRDGKEVRRWTAG